MIKDLTIRNNILAYDTETTGLNPWGNFKRWGFYPARPFEFTFCDMDGNTADIRWEVDPFTRRVIPVKKELKLISDILADPHITKVGHNLRFDIRMSRLTGIKVNASRIHDTMFMWHIITGGNLHSYALKPLGKNIIEFDDDDETNLLNSVKKNRKKAKDRGWCIATEETHGKKYIKADYWLADKSVCKEYAVKDAERTMLLYLSAIEELKENPDLFSVYRKEMKLSRIVYNMELRGVRLLPERVKNLTKYYTEYREKWKGIADKEGGKGLNFNSPKQLVKIFCEDREYTTKKKTDAGNPSIDAAELKRLSKRDKLAKAILEYKVGDSMLSKFMAPYKRLMIKNEKNELILHPNFRQLGARTARFSCADPNLLQVADENSSNKKADIGLRPRECLGPRKGYVWYLPDYSQMEVWVFAILAGYKLMTDALMKGRDFHKFISKKVWGKEKDFKKKRKLYRKKGKTMMFLKIYGGGIPAVMDLLDCSKEVAIKTIEMFNKNLPGVLKFTDKVSSLSSINGFVKNVFGREFHVDSRYSYRSVNHLVQGTCADMLKNSLIRLDKLFSVKWKGCRLLIPIHDEIVIEVPIEKHSKKLMRDIVKVMQRDSKIVGLNIPLPVSMKIAKKRWSETEEMDFIINEWKDKYLWKS